LWPAVPALQRDAMEEIARSARTEGARVYLVGGTVRDLLLGRPLGADCDLAVEGDAVRVAEAIAAAWQTPVTKSAFRTAKLARAGIVFDLVTARRERYARPGALPEVEPASIDEDLRRRDFSIHALAFEIPPGEQGRLLDPCGGVEDLGSKRLRVLHERSFSDDPTRLLRAARFELRLGFRLDPTSEGLAREAVLAGALSTISSTRLREEFELAVVETEDFEPLLRRWADLGVWRFLAGGDVPSPAGFGRLAAWRRAGFGREPRSVLIALACGLDGGAAGRLASSLGLPPQLAAEVVGASRRLADLERTLRQGGSASVLAEAWLAGSPVVREIAAVSPHPGVRASALRAASAARIGLRIGGDALRERGAAAGPSLGAALRATLAARRDGRLGDEEELDYALAWLAENPTR
jgi:tRNA nucleotidyltransferase (CCA-adding enzyme)